MTSIVFEDVSLRDGLQFEQKILPFEAKIEIAHSLVKAGLKRLQIGSFVNPKVVPQMADTNEVFRIIKNDNPNIVITALVLNEKGFERAAKSGLTYLSVSSSASNTHSLKNVRQSANKAMNEVIGLIRIAAASGIQVRAGIQCAFGCVYEGTIPEEKVLEMSLVFAEAGAIELNLADTTGMANPLQIKRLTSKVKKLVPGETISLHLHDTRGLGLANMLAGYEAGAEIFDVSTGGLGGCPFVIGASGNVPTEDAVNLFNQMGIETGIDLRTLCQVVDRYEELLERRLPGHMNRVIKSLKEACA